eukprot:1710646-Rhodomonas_salina.2
MEGDVLALCPCLVRRALILDRTVPDTDSHSAPPYVSPLEPGPKRSCVRAASWHTVCDLS